MSGSAEQIGIKTNHNMLLLTNCEVHTGKYSDRSLDVLACEQGEGEREREKGKEELFPFLQPNVSNLSPWAVHRLGCTDRTK